MRADQGECGYGGLSGEMYPKCTPRGVHLGYICSMVMGLEEILERVRDEGGDTANIEVKSAAGGLSASLVGTMCALSLSQ